MLIAVALNREKTSTVRHRNKKKLKESLIQASGCSTSTLKKKKTSQKSYLICFTHN